MRDIYGARCDREDAACPDHDHDEALAIVGMGCRLPGGVTNLDQFWQLMAEGRDGIVEIPPDRLNLQKFYDARADAPGKIYVRHGGFLDQPIDSFDAEFFGMSPREAAYLDPQQRLLLEVAHEALEDAGIPTDSIAGSNTGVFVGGFMVDGMLTQFSPLGRAQIGQHTAVSSTLTILSNRLSYLLDLHGPSFTLDTACSSSLVAMHQACQAIRGGECDLALVGGVNVIFRPETLIAMCKGGFLSRDGRSKSFDARADGYGRGEGAGVVVIKRLSAALADGDRIHAVIRGSGVNQDGRTDGITVPNGEAQAQLIRQVCARFDCDPGSVTYVEAHGTGTAIGDPIELGALASVFGGAGRERPCLVGSVKANIGHLEAAAGIAAVIKTALCLERGQVPPVANLDKVNPALRLAEWGLDLPRGLTELPPAAKGLPGRAAINSFGYGGTNAHVILEPVAEHGGLSDAPDAAGDAAQDAPARAQLLLISARSAAALRALAGRFLERLQGLDAAGFADLCYSAALRRNAYEHRIAVLAVDAASASAVLRDYLDGRANPDLIEGTADHKGAAPVLVFSGMGPQWWGMGRELMATQPVFRDFAQEVDRIFAPLAGWSILDEMARPEDQSSVTCTHVAQPANFVLQAGLFKLLQSWGVDPGVLIGHSVGEVSAAYAAGVLSLEDAVRVSWLRSKLQATTAGTGGMLAVGLGAADILPYLDGYHDLVSVGADNAPRTITLAGDEAALDAIAEKLTADGIFNRRLQVETAYHSPIMDPLLEPLERGLAGITPRPAELPLYSTVTSYPVAEGDYGAAYWCRNVRDSVRFYEAVQEIVNDGFDCFLEVGPHPVLSSALRECLLDANVEGVLAASLRREQPEIQQILRGIAALHVRGVAIDWQRFHAGRGNRFVTLPGYPWQRHQLWNESDAARDDRLGTPDEARLLGRRMAIPQPMWRQDFNRNRLAWVLDHQVEGSVVMPGAAYCEIALQLAAELAGDGAGHDGDNGGGALRLTGLKFDQAMLLDPNDEPALITTWDPETRGFAIHSAGASGDWTRHAEGRVSDLAVPQPAAVDLDALRRRCDHDVTPAAHYAAMTARGLQYGPAFQGVTALSTPATGGEVLARIVAPEGVDAGAFILHPALLDACFQALISALPDEGGRPAAYVPVRIEEILHHHPVGAEFLCHGRLTARDGVGMVADLSILAPDGRVLAGFHGISARRLGADDADLPEGVDVDALLDRFECVAQTLDQDDRRADPVPLAPMAILSQGGDLASALAEGLTARGHDVRLFGAGAFRFDPAFRQIVDLRGLDPADDPQDPTGQARAEASLDLLHMIAQDGVRRCVTTVVRHADNAPQSAALTSAAQLGLLRVAANEYADLDLRMVQIGGDEVLPALLDELTSDSDEDDIVLIPDQRLVRRLVAVPHGRLAQEAAARRPTGPLAEEEAEIELLLAGAEAPFDVLGRVTSGARAGRLVLTQLPEGMLPQRFLRRPVASLLDLPGDLDWAGDRLLPLLPLAMAHAILRLAGLAQGDRLAVCVGDARMAGALVAVAAMIGAETVQIAGPGDLRGAARRFDAICLDRDDELAEILMRRLVDLGSVIHVGGGAGRMVQSLQNDRRDLFVTAPGMLSRAPARIGASLTEVIAAIRAGTLSPAPAADTARRFAHDQPETQRAATLSASVAAPVISAQGAYLVTGGLGGFGFEIAKWLARRGAGHVILASRRGLETERAGEMLAELRALGCGATAMALDVGDAGSVAVAMRLIADLDLPLRGVFHAAGVLDDAPVYLLQPDQLARVMQPKALGAWHLHQATQGLDLDCFVVISSIAALLGSPGQGAYVAANSFLDALVQHRRNLGLPGIGINLGALAEVGMAARHEGVERHFQRVGVGSLNPVEAIGMLDYILRQNPVNMAAARMDWGLWGGTYAKWAASPRYRHLMPELAAEAGGGAGASLASLSPEARAERVATCLSDLVAGILRLPPDGVDPGKSLLAMGVDSLMAMELQAGIDRQLGLRIPTLELMKGVALRALAANIADRIGAIAADAAAAPRTGSPQPASPPAAPAEPATPVARDVGELLSRLDSLSPAEVEQALAEFALLEESK